MAASAIILQLKSSKKLIKSPFFLHHFSSSSQNPNPTSDPLINNQNAQKTPLPSYCSDLKSSLKNKTDAPSQQGTHQKFGVPRQQQQQTASFDRIKQDLSAFRRLSAPPLDDNSSNVSNQSGPKPISFQELYKRNVAAKEGGLNDINTSKKISLEAIGESLKALRANTLKTNSQNPLSLKTLKESFALRPVDPKNQRPVMGSPQKLPESSVFLKELNEKKDGKESPAMKSRFVKMYEYKELGEKLRRFRPEGKSEGGFSVQELNERLIKLREMEEKESSAAIGNTTFKELRLCLTTLNLKDKEQKLQTLDALSTIGRNPTFMLEPPKEHLVEKYFHPDNMSSAEKLKLELEKVRDEFKMSESDCGSARVQVAQLTTKIKHLTTALHKKDKHSRKGLQGMIQQRKKLLKYLRRTDWDSYTLVLSKFGLRDNPEGKKLKKKTKA